MVGNDLPGERRPAHTRRGLTRQTEARLAELGRQLPPPSEEDAKVMAADRAARVRRRLAGVAVAVTVLALALGAAVQWFRPLPTVAVSGLPTEIHVPGSAPTLPWPATGEAALSVPGVGSVQQNAGVQQPVPVGVLSGVLTAYVILKDHPLATGGAAGPSIAVTPQTLAAYQAGIAAGEPELPVSVGQSVTELTALEGLLNDSDNDMATLLAGWDAANPAAFVAKMDLTAVALGLRHTKITQPGGADDAVASTPGDLIRLGEAAMRIPLFEQIVSLAEVNLPGAGVRYNPNFLLGQNGVVGIVAGADTTANGCFLFAVQKVVGGQTVTLYGAVLGQSGTQGPNTAAVNAGDALMKAALSDLTSATIVQAGQTVGRLAAPWGGSTPVTVSQSVTVPVWAGLPRRVSARVASLAAPVAAGTVVGSLQVRSGSHVIAVPMRNSARLQGPTWAWHLTR